MDGGEAGQLNIKPYLTAAAQLAADTRKLRQRAIILALSIGLGLAAICALLSGLTGAGDPVLSGLSVILGCLFCWLMIILLPRAAGEKRASLLKYMQYASLAQRLVDGTVADDMHKADPADKSPISNQPLDPQNANDQMVFIAINISDYLYAQPRTQKPTPSSYDRLISRVTLGVIVVVSLGIIGLSFFVPVASGIESAILLYFLGFWTLIAAKDLILSRYMELVARQLPKDLEALQSSDFLTAATIRNNLVLNELEYRLGRSWKRRPSLFALVIGLSVAIAVASITSHAVTGNNLAHLSVVWAIAIVAGLASGWLASRITRTDLRVYDARIRAATRQQLRTSDLVQRIAYGQIKRPLVMQWLPWPLNKINWWPSKPADYQDEYKEGIWEAAHNLDWFLSTPKRRFRATWIAPPAFLIVLMFLILLGALGTDYLITALAATLPLYIISSIQSQRTSIRQQVWRDELINHLRMALNE